ncbi:hypothetical protein BN946_scf185040.g5 [Trametes cinnabarina]|uniref:DUF6532 domain-containing protein n=1 Tax=Pycnoporus cinnabarinus TaxID=5643 RepID=A0A060S4N1_PYCCI|nr:hypothetical protein BN946_scf185040.g5 [Trametes cinnabarina]
MTSQGRPMRDSKKAALATRNKPERRASKRRASDSSPEETAPASQSAKKTKVVDSEEGAEGQPTTKRRGRRKRLSAPTWTVESSPSAPEDEEVNEEPAKVNTSRREGRSGKVAHPEAMSSSKAAGAEARNNDIIDGSDGSVNLESDKEMLGSGSDDVEGVRDDADWAQLSDSAKEAEVPQWTTYTDGEDGDAAAQSSLKNSDGKEAGSQRQRIRRTQNSLSQSLNQSSSESSESSDEHAVRGSVTVQPLKTKAAAGKKKVSKGVERRRQSQRELEEPKFRDDEQGTEPEVKDARDKGKKRQLPKFKKRESTVSQAVDEINSAYNVEPKTEDIDEPDQLAATSSIELVYPEGKWNELPLGPQPPRVRKVAHLSIYKVSVCVLFENAFPEGSTAQSLYVGKALIESAAELQFRKIKLRLETDKQYAHDLGTIKRRLATTQPYRNEAILEVLHCSFFDGHPSIAEKYKKEFRSTSVAHPDELELPIAMVALAATAVGSCLLDWLRAGGMRPKKVKSFTADANSDVYAAHVAFLNSIKKDYPSKFHVLMHNLYHTLSGGTLKVVQEANHTMEQAMAVLDLAGMPDE